MFFARLKSISGDIDAELLVPISEETPPNEQMGHIPTPYGVAQCSMAEWIPTIDIAEDADVRDLDVFTTHKIRKVIGECLSGVLESELEDLAFRDHKESTTI